MNSAKTITTDSDLAARPKYYVPYGAEIASGNRAWVLAALMSVVALASLVMFFFVRMQPPTVIRIGPAGKLWCWTSPAPALRTTPQRAEWMRSSTKPLSSDSSRTI